MTIDTAGLPEELIKELRTKRPFEPVSSRQAQVLGILQEHGKCGFNELLVEVYRSSGEVLTRNAIQNVVYQLRNKGLAKKVSNGIYEAAENDQAEIYQRGRPKGVKTTIGCHQCGGKFPSAPLPFENRKFCSPQCIKIFRIKRAGGNCANCKGVLPASPYTYLRKKFCKQSCIEAYKRR